MSSCLHRETYALFKAQAVSLLGMDCVVESFDGRAKAQQPAPDSLYLGLRCVWQCRRKLGPQLGGLAAIYHLPPSKAAIVFMLQTA